MSGAFSTRELAQMWNVSDSTIKRWADSGVLSCLRTPGGHRRFLSHEVERFQRAHGFKATGLIKMRQWREKAAPEKGEEETPERQRARLYEASLENRRAEILEILQRVYLRGATLSELYDRLVLPLDQRLRLEMEQDRLPPGRAQLIRNNLEGALHRLFADAVWRPASDQLGLCGALDSRRPLPLNGIGRLLEAEGWECMNLGSGIGFAHLAEIVRQEPINLICVTSARVPDPEEEGLQDLAKLARAYEIPLALFGIGFHEDFCRYFRTARYCTDFGALQRFVTSLART